MNSSTKGVSPGYMGLTTYGMASTEPWKGEISHFLELNLAFNHHILRKQCFIDCSGGLSPAWLLAVTARLSLIKILRYLRDYAMNTRQLISESNGPVSLSASYNGDCTCFAVGLDTGFCSKLQVIVLSH